MGNNAQRLRAACLHLKKRDDDLCFGNIRPERLKYALAYVFELLLFSTRGHFLSTDVTFFGLRGQIWLMIAHGAASLVVMLLWTERFRPLVRICVAVCAAGFLPFVFLPVGLPRLLCGVIAYAGLGGAVTSARCGYAFALNNAERLFSIAGMHIVCSFIRYADSEAFPAWAAKALLLAFLAGMCFCLLRLYEEEKAKALTTALRAGEESFADFRLDYYRGEARECMELTLAAARAYAEGFGPDSTNLLLQGGTGLGKTFLSRCIARTVAAKGCSVVYETAQEAFAAFEEQKFSRDAETYAAATEKVKRIMQCELLILDDLGTELTTSFTQSALYYIVNSRLTAHRKTVISTNLGDEELAERYLPQIISRLNGEYETLVFMGEDIRAIRKEQRYE